jgi:acyl-CoA reductase-like NAD-dependent aldehyde dehydrogenase
MIIKSINPHDQSVIGETPISSTEEIENMVKKAREALPGWRNTPVEERCKYVTKFGELLKENGEELAKLISMEMGKPLAQARDDVKFELDFVNYYTDNGPKFLADEKVWGDTKNDFRMTYEPYGVVACICPWNFPISMVTSGMLPALVAGNAVVVKPSEYTTLSQKRVVELMQETGIPNGVVGYVIGAGDVGEQPGDCIC